MLKLGDSTNNIPLIGPKYQKLLDKLNIFTITDLLNYFPSYYSDTSKIFQISELDSLEKKTILCTIDDIQNIKLRNKKFITKAKGHDNSSTIEIIWFNQPFLNKTIKTGSKYLLNGKLNAKSNKTQLYSPTYEIYKNRPTTHLGIITPIYSTTDGISSKWIRSRINYLLKNHIYLLNDLKNILPQNLQKRYDLINLDTAIQQIHFPKDQTSLKKAEKRLGFEEMLKIQIKLVKKINKSRKAKSSSINKSYKKIKEFLSSLNFEPTKDQIKAINEITSDFEKKYPANRLLQGDVGCGKTLVAAAISIPIIESSYQVAIMAPTTILAEQHFKTFKELFKNNKYKIKLVTGNEKNKNNLSIEKPDIIIGTQALLFRFKNLFSDLALVIIDEQHRFGVKQRELIISQNSKGYMPHKVTMTATPIPRSIALTLFGDLNISIIDEMPKDRLPTKTYFVPHQKRKASYDWIKKQIKNKDSQVFWLCPLIEESEKLQTKAVTTEYEKLENKILPGLRIDLLHGRLNNEEKNNKIQRMKSKKTDILVSTSVIEVGMDIPDADIIVIEGAERFGLAQLHQLRGRVGRRANQESWCFLFTSENVSTEAIKRLKYFSKVNDGLKVAKYDLQNRGPGEVYGTKQSGIPDLKIASLLDTILIKQTREAAEFMLK